MIRAVLFDATGTLIEPAERVGATYARFAASHGASLAPDRLEKAFRRALAGAGAPLFPEAAASEVPALERGWWRRVVRTTLRDADPQHRLTDLEACFRELFAHYAGPAAWRARRGARALLVSLRRRGLATAVVSNFDGRLPGLLAGLGLLDLLDAVLLPARTHAVKPQRRAFAAALEALGVEASEALFVGDDADRDLAGARAAGLAAVDVRSLATLADLRIPDGEA